MRLPRDHDTDQCYSLHQEKGKAAPSGRQEMTENKLIVDNQALYIKTKTSSSCKTAEAETRPRQPPAARQPGQP